MSTQQDLSAKDSMNAREYAAIEQTLAMEIPVGLGTLR